MKKFTDFLECKNIQGLAKKAKLDVSMFDNHELQAGFEDEKEHDGGEGKDVDVVGDDTDILKIVVAHLREDPKYYTKLHKAIAH